MHLESTFEEALASFQSFLMQEGYPGNVFWIFRDDIWKRAPDDVLIQYPPPAKNEILARKVFDEGCARGLVSIDAVARTAGGIATTVWFPKFDNEEVQGWERGMKLAIIQPFPCAKIITPVRWRLYKFLPRFRQYQRFEGATGTRRWAAA